MMPKNAPDHFMSSPKEDVGIGSPFFMGSNDTPE